MRAAGVDECGVKTVEMSERRVNGREKVEEKKFILMMMMEIIRFYNKK